MNDHAIKFVQGCLNNYFDPPYDSQWSESEKIQITFSKWALEEILSLIFDNPFTPAEETVENLAFRFRVYVEASATNNQRLIFTIAAETAEDLLEKIKEVCA